MIFMIVFKVLFNGNLKSIGCLLKVVYVFILYLELLVFVLYGIVGEFCVSGDQVVIGYLNCFDIMVKFFLIVEDGLVFYCIGDYVCWLLNGEIECLGWRDN